jgi:hypothetical protein
MPSRFGRQPGPYNGPIPRQARTGGAELYLPFGQLANDAGHAENAVASRFYPVTRISAFREQPARDVVNRRFVIPRQVNLVDFHHGSAFALAFGARTSLNAFGEALQGPRRDAKQRRRALKRDTGNRTVDCQRKLVR